MTSSYEVRTDIEVEADIGRVEFLEVALVIGHPREQEPRRLEADGELERVREGKELFEIGEKTRFSCRWTDVSVDDARREVLYRVLGR